jgi:hypothetical protein
MIRMLACTVAILFPSCGDDALKREIAAGEHQVIELEQRLKLMQYRAERADSGSFDDLQAIEGNLVRLGKRERELVTRRAELAETTAQLESQLAESKSMAIRERREQAIGREMDQLITHDGRSFAKARVISVDDAGVSIRHEHGAARLRHADLTLEQQVEFGMDPDLAAAAEQREREEVAAYDQWLEAEMARNERIENSKPPETGRSLATASASSRRIGDTMSEGRTSLLSQPARTFGTGSIYRYSSYRSYRPTYRHVYYYQPYCPSYQRSYQRIAPSTGVVRPFVPRQSP